MSGRVTVVSKGRIAHAVDRVLEHPDESHRTELTPDLDLVRLGLDRRKRILRQTDEPHSRNDWFEQAPPRRRWWVDPNNQIDPDQDVMKSAYRKAVQLATANGQQKPIVSYWICGMPEHFEAMVSETEREVHVFWITPEHRMLETGEWPDSNEAIEEDLYLIAKRPRCDSVKAVFPSGYPVGDPEPEVGEVFSMRLPGY